MHPLPDLLGIDEIDYLDFIALLQKKNAIPCDICRGKGFYICKLCKGNATIKWSPLYDPVFINPCLCPTCDGHRSVFLLCLPLFWEGKFLKILTW